MAESWTSGRKTSLPGASYNHLMYTDRRDFYLNPNLVKEAYPSETPFITFAAKLKTVKTNDPDFKMFEHRGKWLKMNGYSHAAIDWSSGTYPAEQENKVMYDSTNSTACAYITKGDILEFRAATAGSRNDAGNNPRSVGINDIIAVAVVVDYDSNGADLVPLTPSSSTIDVAENDPFTIIGNAYAEGGRSPEAWSDELEVVWNSTQISKTPVEITNTVKQMTLRGYPNEYARLRAEKFKEHKIKLNRTALFGYRVDGNSATSTTGHRTDNMAEIGESTGTALPAGQIRTTMGIIPMLRTYGTANVNYFTRTWADYTINAFIDDMEAFYSQNVSIGQELFAFVGYSVMSNFSKIGPDSFMGRSGSSIFLSDVKTTSFGFSIRQLVHPFGVWNLVLDPSLNYLPYSNSMLVVDPDNISRVVFRPMQYQVNIGPADKDGQKDQYLSDEGIGITLIEKHAYFQFQ